MSKQTAVEWLVKQLELDTRFDGIMNNVIEEAKAMEKEQIVEAWSAGKKNPFIVQYSECCENNGKQYYNETYLSNKG